MSELKKLNIGSGERPMEGYVNVDWQDASSVDVVHDLNQLPYPFEDNSIDEIYISHVLEHLDRPFFVMKEFHRILKNGGVLHIKVPHFSRGFTHAEHAHGFDITFPMYFRKEAKTSGYYGFEFEEKKTELHWMAFFHLMPFMGVSKTVIGVLRVVNATLSWFANLSPMLCSRVWCYWVGGFEEIEFVFLCKK